MDERGLWIINVHFIDFSSLPLSYRTWSIKTWFAFSKYLDANDDFTWCLSFASTRFCMSSKGTLKDAPITWQRKSHIRRCLEWLIVINRDAFIEISNRRIFYSLLKDKLSCATLGSQGCWVSSAKLFNSIESDRKPCRSWWELHRLRSHAMVSSTRASGRRHFILDARWCLGDRLCFCRAYSRRCSLGWSFGRWSAVPNSTDFGGSFAKVRPTLTALKTRKF